MGAIKNVTGIATQGRAHSNEYVLEYRIQVAYLILFVWSHIQIRKGASPFGFLDTNHKNMAN